MQNPRKRQPHLEVRAKVSKDEDSGQDEVHAAILNVGGCMFTAIGEYVTNSAGTDLVCVTARGDTAMRELAAALKTIVNRIEERVGPVKAKGVSESRHKDGMVYEPDVPDPSTHMSVAQAAEKLGKSKTTLRRWISGGFIQATRYSGCWYIPNEEVERIRNT